ncbi:HNH endonuclease [Vibrio atypicus]|uniref:HNH endonuclease n=1 Tax=Vibrio atypicus TaxID=558271 RepID=UPI00135A2D2B|nr:HNH endonuclease signature motif containing protein [Vibrio atypicus]
MKEKIKQAFVRYDEGERPQNYGRPGHWYVLDQENVIYPAKIIWALANNISDTTDFHSKYAREQFVLNGFGLFDSRNQKDNDFDIAVNIAIQDSSVNRRKRLSQATKKPKVIYEMVKRFKRNPDVVAEVLLRADGKCEGCNEAAPFPRRTDGTGYLEVHHKLPLAKGGEDTVENAVAMCPNCHREAHFG